MAPTTGVATTASDVRPLGPTIGVKSTAGVVRPAAGAMGVEKTASEVRPLGPMTGDGTTARAVLLSAMMIGVGVCSADDPIAKVTTGPAVCSAGRDGMITAPFSLGVASMLTPLLENVGLKVTLATVVARLAETSIALADPVTGIAGLPPFSATVMAWEMDGPAPSGETVITVDGIAAPPISVEVGKLDSAV